MALYASEYSDSSGYGATCAPLPPLEWQHGPTFPRACSPGLFSVGRCKSPRAFGKSPPPSGAPRAWFRRLVPAAPDDLEKSAPVALASVAGDDRPQSHFDGVVETAERSSGNAGTSSSSYAPSKDLRWAKHIKREQGQWLRSHRRWYLAGQEREQLIPGPGSPLPHRPSEKLEDDWAASLREPHVDPEVPAADWREKRRARVAKEQALNRLRLRQQKWIQDQQRAARTARSEARRGAGTGTAGVGIPGNSLLSAMTAIKALKRQAGGASSQASQRESSERCAATAEPSGAACGVAESSPITSGLPSEAEIFGADSDNGGGAGAATASPKSPGLARQALDFGDLPETPQGPTESVGASACKEEDADVASTSAATGGGGGAPQRRSMRKATGSSSRGKDSLFGDSNNSSSASLASSFASSRDSRRSRGEVVEGQELNIESRRPSEDTAACRDVSSWQRWPTLFSHQELGILTDLYFGLPSFNALGGRVVTPADMPVLIGKFIGVPPEAFKDTVDWEPLLISSEAVPVPVARGKYTYAFQSLLAFLECMNAAVDIVDRDHPQLRWSAKAMEAFKVACRKYENVIGHVSVERLFSICQAVQVFHIDARNPEHQHLLAAQTKAVTERRSHRNETPIGMLSFGEMLAIILATAVHLRRQKLEEEACEEAAVQEEFHFTLVEMEVLRELYAGFLELKPPATRRGEWTPARRLAALLEMCGVPHISSRDISDVKIIVAKTGHGEEMNFGADHPISFSVFARWMGNAFAERVGNLTKATLHPDDFQAGSAFVREYLKACLQASAPASELTEAAEAAVAAVSVMTHAEKGKPNGSEKLSSEDRAGDAAKLAVPRKSNPKLMPNSAAPSRRGSSAPSNHLQGPATPSRDTSSSRRNSLRPLDQPGRPADPKGRNGAKR